MKRTYPSRKPTKKVYKNYLTPDEVQTLLKATTYSRHSKRDSLIILIMYRHGLRASELCDLRKSDVDLKEKVLNTRRVKHGLSTHQPLSDQEVKLLAKHLLTHDHDYLFISERGEPLTRVGIWHMITALGKKCGFPRMHPHMLRHSTGYYLANQGHDIRLIQDYLGHMDIQSTVRYTKVNPERFKHLWQDDKE